MRYPSRSIGEVYFARCTSVRSYVLSVRFGAIQPAPGGQGRLQQGKAAATGARRLRRNHGTAVVANNN